MSSQCSATKPRYAFIDLAKGICIMLVVWHHVASTWGLETYFLKETLSTFRMPLYFFLSGLFFKEYSGFLNFALRKVNKLLIPFLFFYVMLSCLLPFVLSWFHLRPNPGIHVWTAFFWSETFPNVPIWFLLSLFWTNLLFYGLFLGSKKVSPRYQLAFLAVTSLIVGLLGCFLGRNGVKLPLFLSSSFSSVPYFCVGHLVYRRSPFLAPNRLDRWNIPLALACLVAVALLTISSPPEAVSYVANRYWIPIWSVYLCGFLGTISILFLSKAIGKIPLISYFGRYSIMILVTHGWVQWGIIKMLRDLHVHWPKPFALIVVFFSTMLLYLALIPLMRRFLPHVTAQKDVFRVEK